MDKMDRERIVPDVLDFLPKAEMEVQYDNNISAQMGNVLTPTQVKTQPNVKWKPESSNTYYTLAMVDPDAPSRNDPKFREWHHWLVVNIRGNDIQTGEVLSAYIGAGPPEGTDLHRYVFLVYKQKDKIKCDEPRLKANSGKNRAKFRIRDFANKYNLGNPIAGNFFKAKFDNYVPELYKQLAGG